MAGRPPKALGLVTGHLTNAQKEARAAAEKSMSTGKPMKKWPKTKENPLANKLFGKLAAAYTAIGMNDAMHEAVINRDCIITAECEALETRQKALRAEQENQDAEKTAQLESAIAKIDAALNVRRATCCWPSSGRTCSPSRASCARCPRSRRKAKKRIPWSGCSCRGGEADEIRHRCCQCTRSSLSNA